MPREVREGLREEVTFELGFEGRIGVLQTSGIWQSTFQVERAINRKAGSRKEAQLPGDEAAQLS